MEQQQRIAGALVDALADKDTGVSCDAAAALQTYGSNQQGVLPLSCYALCLQSQHQCSHAALLFASLVLPSRLHTVVTTAKHAGFQDLTSPQGAGRQLSAVLASPDPVVRMRAIALVIGFGAQSESAVKALQDSGLLSHPHAATCSLHLTRHACASTSGYRLLNDCASCQLATLMAALARFASSCMATLHSGHTSIATTTLSRAWCWQHSHEASWHFASVSQDRGHGVDML